MTETLLSITHVLIHLILISNLRGSFIFPFTEEEAETQKSTGPNCTPSR